MIPPCHNGLKWQDHLEFLHSLPGPNSFRCRTQLNHLTSIQAAKMKIQVRIMLSTYSSCRSIQVASHPMGSIQWKYKRLIVVGQPITTELGDDLDLCLRNGRNIRRGTSHLSHFQASLQRSLFHASHQHGGGEVSKILYCLYRQKIVILLWPFVLYM